MQLYLNTVEKYTIYKSLATWFKYTSNMSVIYIFIKVIFNAVSYADEQKCYDQRYGTRMIVPNAHVRLLMFYFLMLNAAVMDKKIL